jgi:hypothetical protein
MLAALKLKINYCICILYSKRFDIVLVTEMWLNDRIPAGILDPENQFNIVRCDRKSGQSGGMCAFGHQFQLDIIEIPVIQYFCNLEICCFDVFC